MSEIDIISFQSMTYLKRAVDMVWEKLVNIFLCLYLSNNSGVVGRSFSSMIPGAGRRQRTQTHHCSARLDFANKKV